MQNYEALVVIPFSTDDELSKEEFLEYVSYINKKISTDIQMYVREVEEEPKMKTQFTPEEIDSLDENEVFVFGSNLAGRHGAGAAKLAVDKFGAIYGQGCGLQGQSYGIATKGKQMEILSLDDIELQVENFLTFAELNPQLTFYTTMIGCGLAGYTPCDIAPLFKGEIPENVILPKEFWEFGAGA